MTEERVMRALLAAVARRLEGAEHLGGGPTDLLLAIASTAVTPLRTQARPRTSSA